MFFITKNQKQKQANALIQEYNTNENLRRLSITKQKLSQHLSRLEFDCSQREVLKILGDCLYLVDFIKLNVSRDVLRSGLVLCDQWRLTIDSHGLVDFESI